MNQTEKFDPDATLVIPRPPHVLEAHAPNRIKESPPQNEGKGFGLASLPGVFVALVVVCVGLLGAFSFQVYRDNQDIARLKSQLSDVKAQVRLLERQLLMSSSADQSAAGSVSFADKNQGSSE